MILCAPHFQSGLFPAFESLEPDPQECHLLSTHDDYRCGHEYMCITGSDDGQELSFLSPHVHVLAGLSRRSQGGLRS